MDLEFVGIREASRHTLSLHKPETMGGRERKERRE